MPERVLGLSASVSLIGLRGVGKSSVGRLLAERLGVTFLDLDLELVKDHGRRGESTGELLERVGLPAFRDMESESLSTCLQGSPPMVLATGGGTILRPGNRELLSAHTFCVWLTDDPERLAQRVALDPQFRPALTGLSPLEEMRQLAADRESSYASASKLCLETGELSIETIAERIISSLRD
jgi:shikimate kinase